MAALAMGIVREDDLDEFLTVLWGTSVHNFEADSDLQAHLWEYAVDSKRLVGRESGWTFHPHVQLDGYALVLKIRRDKKKSETVDDNFSMFYSDMARAPGEAAFRAGLARVECGIAYQQADGNSLFRAFEHQLKGNPEEPHARIRTKMVKFMTRQGRLFFGTLSNHLSQRAWVSRLQQMKNAGTPSKTPGTCGGFLEALALAHAYKKYVVVHQHRQLPLVFPSPTSTRRWPTVHLPFHGGSWWGSVTRIGGALLPAIGPFDAITRAYAALGAGAVDAPLSVAELVERLPLQRAAQYQLAVMQAKAERPYIVAIDTGRINLLNAVVSWKDGGTIMELRRNGYYEISGINHLNRSAAKWQRPLEDIDAKLSLFPKCTTNPLLIQGRRRVLLENWVVIWENVFRMDRARKAFTCGTRKASTIDTHLARYKPANVPADQVEVVYGNAKFGPTGKGERAVPVAHVHKRCKEMYKRTILIDEAFTTKVHSRCHERLAPVVGQTRLDVQCGNAAHVLRGLKFCRHCRHYVSRDGNAARNIYALYIHQLVCGQGTRPPAFGHHQRFQPDPRVHFVGNAFQQGGEGDGGDEEEGMEEDDEEGGEA